MVSQWRLKLEVVPLFEISVATEPALDLANRAPCAPVGLRSREWCHVPHLEFFRDLEVLVRHFPLPLFPLHCAADVVHRFLFHTSLDQNQLGFFFEPRMDA